MRKRPSFRGRSPRETAAAAAAAQTPGNVHSWPFGAAADAKEPLVWRSLSLSCLPSALFIGVSTYRPTPAQVGFALYNTLQTRIEAEKGFRSGTRMHTERGRLLHAISPPWGTHTRGLLLSITGFLRRVCVCLSQRRRSEGEAAPRAKRYLRPRRERRSEGGGGMARTRATFAHTSLAHLHTRQAGREAAERRLM